MGVGRIMTFIAYRMLAVKMNLVKNGRESCQDWEGIWLRLGGNLVKIGRESC